MNLPGNKRGQAVSEFAVMGSLILIVFGAMVAYTQQLNDTQYAQMENFRRTLAQAYEGDGDTPGGLVHGVFIEDRRVLDFDSGYKKGQPRRSVSTADVFWGVPERMSARGNDSYRPDEEVFMGSYYQVNNDKVDRNFMRGPVGNYHAYWSDVRDVSYKDTLDYTEDSVAGGPPATGQQFSDAEVTHTITTDLVRMNGGTKSISQKNTEDGQGYDYSEDGGGVTYHAAW